MMYSFSPSPMVALCLISSPSLFVHAGHFDSTAEPKCIRRQKVSSAPRTHGDYSRLRLEDRESEEQPEGTYRVYLSKWEEKRRLESLWTILQCKKKYRTFKLHFVVEDTAEKPAFNALNPLTLEEAVKKHYAKARTRRGRLDDTCVQEKMAELKEQYIEELEQSINQAELTDDDKKKFRFPQLGEDEKKKLSGYLLSTEVAENLEDNRQGDNVFTDNVFTFNGETYLHIKEELPKQSSPSMEAEKPIIFDAGSNDLEEQLEKFIAAIKRIVFRIMKAIVNADDVM